METMERVSQPGDAQAALDAARQRLERKKRVSMASLLAELERIMVAPEAETWQAERWDGMS